MPSNLENLNAYLIERGISRQERLVELNKATPSDEGFGGGYA